MKLLIVDDYADARDIIRSYLNHLGFEIHECDSGEAAIAHLIQTKTNLPDVMTLDLRMGIEGGVPVLQFIRTHFPSIHVVVVTQFKQPAINELVLRLGAARCFAKADLSELRTYIEGYQALRSAS